MKIITVSETGGPLLVTVAEAMPLTIQQFKLEGASAKRAFLKMLGKCSKRKMENNGYYYSITYWVD